MLELLEANTKSMPVLNLLGKNNVKTNWYANLHFIIRLLLSLLARAFMRSNCSVV